METIRLYKVAKEFNISVHSIVNYLGEKGYNIPIDPNYKLTDDQYKMLTKEFHNNDDNNTSKITL